MAECLSISHGAGEFLSENNGVHWVFMARAGTGHWPREPPVYLDGEWMHTAANDDGTDELSCCLVTGHWTRVPPVTLREASLWELWFSMNLWDLRWNGTLATRAARSVGDSETSFANFNSLHILRCLAGVLMRKKSGAFNAG